MSNFPCPAGLSRSPSTSFCQSTDPNMLEQLMESPDGCSWRCAAKATGVASTDATTSAKFTQCAKAHGLSQFGEVTPQGVLDILTISAPGCAPNEQHGCIGVPSGQYALDYSGAPTPCPAAAPPLSTTTPLWISTHAPQLALAGGCALAAFLIWRHYAR
jgi:hypothetical protein